MPVNERDVPDLVKAIMEKLSLDDLGPIYMKAVGGNLAQYFPPGLRSIDVGVRNALEDLLDGGRERWLMTHILASPKVDLTFRRYVALKCGDAIAVGDRLGLDIDRFLDLLKQFEPALKDRCFSDVTRKVAPVAEALEQVVALKAYKTMHEALHASSVALAGATAGGPTVAQLFGEGPAGLAAVSAAAKDAAGLLGPERQAVELAWIGELADLAAEGGAQVRRGGAVEDDVLRASRNLVTRQLYWLDSRIFNTAGDLPLTAILGWAPGAMEIELADSATDWTPLKAVRPTFEHAVRELGPSVLARALVHKLWQEADRSLAQLDLAIETTQAADVEDVDDRWRPIRDLVRWFARQDGADVPWAANAMLCSDRIDDEIARENGAADLRPLLSDYRRAVRLRFLAVDGEMKADCLTLVRIEPPLIAILDALR